MPIDLASKVRAYAAMAESLPRYAEWEEAMNVLVTRDAIRQDVLNGVRLPIEGAKLLDEADAALAKHRRLLLKRFPEVFEASQRVPPDYWWWHLDEGPRVREHALATTSDMNSKA